MNKDFRTQMMALWHKIFGDSYDYISMLFDTYFEKSYTDGYMDNNKLISCIMAIPYTIASPKFNSNTCIKVKDNSFNYLYSGYLCGLATDDKYRKQGIMSKMIKKCNMSLFKNNFALSFLIPSNDNTRKYYKKFGYVNVSYHCEYSYKINDENINLLDANNVNSNARNYKCFRLKEGVKNCIKLNKLKINFTSDCTFKYSDIIDLIQNKKILLSVFNEYYLSFEELRNSIYEAIVFHTFNDFITILKENLINDGEILLLKDAENKPLGMIFCSKYIQDEVVVQLLISKSEEIDNILLETLKSILPASTNIRVRNHLHCSAGSDFSAGNKKDTDYSSQPNLKIASALGVENCEVENITTENFCVKPYAMVKILNVAEVLKFASAVYPSSKFSILVKEDEFEENRGLFIVKDGVVDHIALDSLSGFIRSKENAETSSGHRQKKICIDGMKVADLGTCHELTVPELAAALFSNVCPTSDMQPGQIPALPLTVALMLD